ncbi:UDP-N-acetylmuramate dehydrogenase [Thermodesulfobacteriota bacterium]
MNKRQCLELMKIVPGGIEFNRAMDQYTTFRIGGKAEAICFPNELDLLRQMVSYLSASNIPYLIVGKGSNLLVKDGGIRGVVIILKGKLAAIETNGINDETVFAGGGLTIVELLSYCSLNGLTGLEFLAGIPGTVGGAVFMNAGAYGKEIGSMIQEIHMLTGQGESALMNGSRITFSYRKLHIPKGMVIHKVKFKLRKEYKNKITERITEYLKRRKETQPLDYPSGGSVFRNPPNDYAGRLIEKAGLKGTRIGGASISRKHANFIVNRGNAKAEDILALMNLVRKKVMEETGIDLEPEIRVVGE